jgi:hypothetical protein
MARQYSARVEDLGGVERLAALENERMIRRESQPSAFDKLAGLGVGVANSVMNWRKGNQILQTRKKQEDDQLGAEMAAKGFKQDESGQWTKAPELQSATIASTRTYAPGIKQVGNEVYEYDPNNTEGARWNLLHTLPPEDKGIKFRYLGGGGIRIKEGTNNAEKFNSATGKYEPYSQNPSAPVGKPGQTGPQEGDEKIENQIHYIYYNGNWVKAED